MGVADRIAHRIARAGPIPFDAFVEAALYDEEGGFFTRGRGAGRDGRDFVTSPEVGPLFGELVARALDGWWRDLGAPDPYLVVEVGAGRGRLAREVLRAGPECLGALRYLLVERSAGLRDLQRDLLEIEPVEAVLGPYALSPAGEAPVPVAGRGPVFASLGEMPAGELEGVVVANELLDNLPFGLARWSGDGWSEVRVGLAGDGSFVEVALPASDRDRAALEEWTRGVEVPPGTELPIPRGVEAWLGELGSVLRSGYVVVIDYVEPVAELVRRGPRGWLRTYRAHRRGNDPLRDPGEQDITADVPAEALRRAATAAGLVPVSEDPQSRWLASLGIDELVAEGRRAWEAARHAPDLEAIAGRSRSNEAGALTDPAGLGGHRVLVYRRGTGG